MLNLNYLDIDIVEARKKHVEFFSCYVIKRLTGEECKVSKTDGSHPSRPQFCNGIHKRSSKSSISNYRKLQDFIMFDNRLETILGGKPKDLEIVNNALIVEVDRIFGADSYKSYIDPEVKTYPSSIQIKRFFKDVNAIFNYERLKEDKDYSSYHLSSNLGVRSCTYCNRTYALTHKKGSNRLLSPQLDHWFPQSKFPLLQISFSNLIPSCEYCNSRVKSNQVYKLATHFHPYQDLDEKFYFTFYPTGGPEKYRVVIGSNSGKNIKATCEDMCIDEMYNAHIPELEDLITLKKAYSKTYLQTLKRVFGDASLTEAELYRLAFGTELLEKNFHLRPMSKFKSDILHKKGII